MAVSEDRLQLLLPRQLKRAVERQAKRLGMSIGAYVRRLIEVDLGNGESGDQKRDFPFGKNPIHTGRTKGSVEHDRPE